ncbi:MAG: hypothetical protein EOO69_06415 [Moraxellaceae bacterium]|nr:MAG: hypothetical protein EOO69_06415 [Moraxellaceae bacterium]
MVKIYTPDLRIKISLGIWFVCLPSLLVSVVGLMLGVAAIVSKQFDNSAFLTGLACIISLIPWMFLIHMNVKWVDNEKLSKWIPVIGTILALICLVMLFPASLFALPPMLFACYLAYWHLKI